MAQALLARSGSTDSPVIGWEPQAGPQTAFVNCPVFEVVYGGARGGGKTDAAMGDWVLHQAEFGKHAAGLFVRRKQADLATTLERAKAIFGAAGAKFNEQKSTFRFPSGAVIWFRYLDRDNDADNYQGQSFTRVYVEELTQFPKADTVNKLKATLRSANDVPCGFRATCNPGGPGHLWVKHRYINPGPWKIIAEEFVSPFDGATQTLERVFIPARLTDNALLMRSDPLYVAKLQQSGSRELVRAWLEGDWDIVEGAFFDGWSSRNVVRPFQIPAEWMRFRSFDWGFAAPFSVQWWAVATDDLERPEGIIPRGALIHYREWYGSNGKPNEGLRLTADAVAEGIKAKEAGEKVVYGVADPSIFKEDGGPSHGERMRRAGVNWRPADNARVAKSGAMGGWDQMRQRINPINAQGESVGRPMLYVFDTCRDFLRTVPTLQHDPDRPEDLDTTAEDHIADAARYACMSRPMPAIQAVKPNNPVDLWGRSNKQADGWRVA